MTNFFEGLELFNQQPQIDFTPEYRVYYDSETGEVVDRYATQYDYDPPDCEYITLDRNEWEQVKPNVHKVIDGEVRAPRQGKAYYLKKSDSGYGTKKNNPYFVGTEDYYEYDPY